MHRHHPYNSSFDGPPRRGGPSGERPFRGGPPRGRGRGRGGAYGGSGYESPEPAPYTQAPASESSYYSSYGNQPPAEYSNQPPAEYSTHTNGYGAPPPLHTAPASHPAPPPPAHNGYGPVPSQANGYEQSYKGYEGAQNEQFDYSGYPPAPANRRDEHPQEAIISERLNREKPCRTLFTRNIKYETSSDEVRQKFEDHGDVKTFFDLIANRGMVFVTYFDLRAAERARERLQGSELAGRPIDVHYSLPRDEAGDKNVEMQGALIVTLRDSPSRQPIDDYELRRQFQHVGDIKAVRPVVGRPDQRIVDFYDLRACDVAMERLRHQPLQDGFMELAYGWAEEDMTTSTRGGRRGRDLDDGPRGRRPRRSRGGRGRGAFNQEDDRKQDWDGDRGSRPRFQDPNADRGHEHPEPRGPGGYGPPPHGRQEPHGRQDGYGPPPPAAPEYAQMAPPPVQTDDRLEQARKVQQLLAALKGSQAVTAAPALAPAVPIQHAPGPNYYGQSAPAAPMYQTAPSAQAYQSAPPPPSAYGAPPGGAPHTYGGAPAGGAPLPPGVLAMLQGGGPPSSYPPPAAPAYGGQHMNPPPAQPGPGQPSYEQLMTMFQNQAAAAGRR